MNIYKTIRVIGAAVTASALAYAPLAFAVISTDAPLSASACSMQNSAIAFDNYTSGESKRISNIAVMCTSGIFYNVGLDPGKGAGASTTARVMTSTSGDSLNYALFQDSARTRNWGSTSSNDTRSEVGSGATQNLIIYGYIPANQSPRSGTYSDTVTVTLTY